MKIDLKFPYNQDFIAGYVNINKEPRRVLLLVKVDKSQTSTSYARYLMSCKLGRYLDNIEHVDHIDNDQLNDDVDNLQILTKSENNLKKNLKAGIKLQDPITLICPICKKEFTRPSRNIKHKLLKQRYISCSRKCGGIMSHLNLNEPKHL